MPVPDVPSDWWGSLLWLAALAGVAFSVAWLTGTRLRIRRAAYIPFLAAVTAAVGAAYLAWLDLDLGEALTARWAWGLVAGVVVGVVLVPAIRRQPVERHLDRRDLPVALSWEGVVYGAAEGTLLSALPAFMTWQMLHQLDWAGAPGAIARWTLPILAAAAVIVIHHLGYWDYRNRILVPVTIACSLLTVAFLVSGSFLAPIVGHIVMHIAADLHGVVMPPKDRLTQLRPDVSRISKEEVQHA